MGLFDKMFGKGASESEQQQGAQQRFNELKGKYQSVLNMADQEHIQFQNLHVQDNKLYIRGHRTFRGREEQVLGSDQIGEPERRRRDGRDQC